MIPPNVARVMRRNLSKDSPVSSLQEDGVEKKTTVQEDMWLPRGDFIAPLRGLKIMMTMNGAETEGTLKFQEEVETKVSTRAKVKDQGEVLLIAKDQEPENVPREQGLYQLVIPFKKLIEKTTMVEIPILLLLQVVEHHQSRRH